MARKNTVGIPESNEKHILSSRYILASMSTFFVVFVSHINYITGHYDALL